MKETIMETINFIQSGAINIKDVACVLSVSPGDKWVAFHVKYDFVTQGKTRKETIDSMEQIILGQIYLDIEAGIEPLSETNKWSDYD